MRGLESASYRSALRSYLHTAPRRGVVQPEPKSDQERAKLGLPLREPWFEVKPFDEKKKTFVLRLKEILQAQFRQKIEVAALGQLRQELDVVRQGKQRKIATYVRRFPAAFSLRSFYTPNNKKKTWCSFSADALELLAEEDLLFQASEAIHVEKLRKLLMISMKKRLPFSSVNQVRESLGFPFDFKETLVNKHPDVFLLKERKGCIYLELKDWDETLAVSALEKHAQEARDCSSKTLKKRKKQRRERLIADEEGNEQETSHGMDNEEGLLSGEENEDMILTCDDEGEEQVNATGGGNDHDEESYEEEEVNPIVEGDTHEEEARCVESLSLKGKLKSIREGEARKDETSHEQTSSQKEGTCSVHARKSNGRQRGSLADHENCGEPENLEDLNDTQNNIFSLSDHQIESFQDVKTLAAPKLVHSVEPCLSASVVEKHPQDMDFVSKTGHGVSQNGTDVDVSAGAGDGHHCKNIDEEQFQSSTGMYQNSTGMYQNAACLHFPWKNKRGKQPNSKHAAEIVAFQSAPYISPYRNSRDLELPLKSSTTEKFVVGVIHEFLSLTLEKRATLEQLELFQRPYRLPGNLLQFLQKYDGIFYVVRGKTKSHVFLKEAYKESILLEKEPLVLWQERFVELAFSTQKPEKSKSSKESLQQQAQVFRNEV